MSPRSIAADAHILTAKRGLSVPYSLTRPRATAVRRRGRGELCVTVAGVCRLFGMIARAEPVQATFWLLDAPDSLAVQSHQNADGTGVGFFDPDGTPHVDKQPIAAFEDRQFAAEAKEIWSRTFVSHVRHATTGGLTIANTHPFCQHERLFAHNGVINDLPKLEQRLGDDLALVAGDSDSERYFALITGEIDRHGGDVGAGIRTAVRWIVQNVSIVSINFVLVTATELWALRYPEIDTLFVLERTAGGAGPEAPRPLEQTSSQGTRVHCEHTRDRPLVIIASERMDDDRDWREVPSGELVHVDASLRLTTERLFDSAPPRA
jgi:predicted glutamine amidotransferase